MHPNPVTLRTACAAMFLVSAAMPAAAAQAQPQPQSQPHKAEFRLTVLPAHYAIGKARFYPVANARLELRTLPSGAGGCARETSGANEPFIGMLRASDYLVTHEFGRSAMP